MNATTEADAIRARITRAFASVEPPPAFALAVGQLGREPRLVAEAFASVPDWRLLEPAFLDRAPDDLSSALSFFSLEALRYYLPAYLLADLDGRLSRVDVAFHLTGDLDDRRWNERVNARRYGAQTALDYARFRFSIFEHDQVDAIVAYLRHVARRTSRDEGTRIEQALRRYWLPRADELARLRDAP